MGNINIFKIDDKKHELFINAINEKFEYVGKKEIRIKINEEEMLFEMLLYISQMAEEKDVNWNWLLEEFDRTEIKVLPNPRALLIIMTACDIYCVTFGYAYFLADKYCDRNFAFQFARKLDYKEIKTTTLTSPHSQRNKTINSYLNYNNFEFESGESFAKIKAKVQNDEGFSLHKELVEIGNSIKFSVSDISLEHVANLVWYVDNTIENKEDKCAIPVFGKIKDEALIQTLNERLLLQVKENPGIINFSEIDIIGATEILNQNDTSFQISYWSGTRLCKKNIADLSQEQIQQFADENNLDLNEHLLDITVVSFRDGISVRTDPIRNLIDYTDDVERCILSKGQWYQYNDDYLSYLADSIDEIDVVYNAEYNFSKSAHKEFIERKVLEEGGQPIYSEKTPEEISKGIGRKYYAERYYNTMLSEKFEFQNYDRELCCIGASKIELMDLYKESTMFAVKIGASSSKLCYVVDQSIQALKAYKFNAVAEYSAPRCQDRFS